MNTQLLNRFFVIVSFILIASVSILSAQTEMTLTPVKDNTLYEDAAGALSNGKGIYLFAGKTAAKNAGKVRRALIQFDVAGNIPAGSTIQSAVLSLNMSKTISGNHTVSLHKVGAGWGEGSSDASAQEGQGATATSGDATWIHRIFDSATWSIAGGDFSPTVSTSQSVGGNGPYTWGSTSEMVADVQSWLDNTAENFGWIAVGFNPSNRMKDANFVIGYVTNDIPNVRDEWGTHTTSHQSDVSLGGTDDVQIIRGQEIGGSTEIEFLIPLNSGDAYDRMLNQGQSYPVLLARRNGDDFTTQHTKRGQVTIEL